MIVSQLTLKKKNMLNVYNSNTIIKAFKMSNKF